VFERFTDRARRVVILAQNEAAAGGHLGTGHLLLGLSAEGEGVAAQALEAAGVTEDRLRLAITGRLGGGPVRPDPHLPFDARTKKVLELAFREALLLGNNYVSTEHLLLGLLREGQGTGAAALAKCGADLDDVRVKVLELLRGRVVLHRHEPALADVLAAVNSLGERLGVIEQLMGIEPAAPDDATPDIHVDWHCTPDEFRQLAEALASSRSPYVEQLRAEGKLSLPAVTP
jgi:ATP-dependent Clp protease ATP-binding subunit ClpA